MKPKEQISFEKEVARRNKLFAGKTNLEKRVLLAKDVIARVNNKTVTVRKGDWVKIHNNTSVFSYDLHEKSFQEVLLKNKVICKVCAIGGLIVAATTFNNNVKCDALNDNLYPELEGRRKGVLHAVALDGIFTLRQLSIIEGVFELSLSSLRNIFCNAAVPIEIKNRLVEKRFWKYFGEPDDEKRLVMIMKSIIRNKGIINL